MNENNRAIDAIIVELSNNYTHIIERKLLTQHPRPINWGNNGTGDRWCNKIYNYSVIYRNSKTKLYSQYNTEVIPEDILTAFLAGRLLTGTGVIGIYIHSIRNNKTNRPISVKISRQIKLSKCVHCGTSSDLICDHKNYLYNDEKVLSTKTQQLSDFQSLCNHCNLLKRQINITEKKQNKLYSALDIPKLNGYDYFPWEKYTYSPSVIQDTYWYDPVEFMNKVRLYNRFTLPIVIAIKNRQLNLNV